jgi:hypothetical protein
VGLVLGVLLLALLFQVFASLEGSFRPETVQVDGVEWRIAPQAALVREAADWHAEFRERLARADGALLLAGDDSRGSDLGLVGLSVPEAPTHAAQITALFPARGGPAGDPSRTFTLLLFGRAGGAVIVTDAARVEVRQSAGWHLHTVEHRRNDAPGRSYRFVRRALAGGAQEAGAHALAEPRLGGGLALVVFPDPRVGAGRVVTTGGSGYVRALRTL